MAQLLLATKNLGKLKEFRELIQDSSWQVLSLQDFPDIPDIEENGTTFQENAHIKAEAVAKATGIITIADDSGLEVDYLNGAPGVYSARFAGEPKDDTKNNEKLLSLIKDVAQEKRTARFRCVIAIVVPERETFYCDGVCEGIIGTDLIGDNGFGYDPLFYLPQFDKTMAQLSMEEKNNISHRGKAFHSALPILEKLKDRIK